MARTSLTKTTALGSYGDYSTANAADLTMAAADVVNGNQFVSTGRDLLIARNSGGSAYYVTVSSSEDPYGREGDITQYDVGAGEVAIFGPFKRPGWVQSDGYIYVDAENAAVYLGVVALPA